MTAAYTNDPVTQEQNVEKKTSTIDNKASENTKEETMREENTEITCVEMTKLAATGGQDQKEIPVNQERSTLCISVDSSAFLEQKGKDMERLECKKYSEDSESLKRDENIVPTIDDNRNAIADATDIRNSQVSRNGESSGAKSSSDSIVSTRFDALLVESDPENTMSGTRGTDASSNDNFTMQELQNSIQNDIIESTNFTNDPEVCNGLPKGADFSNDLEEIYDPESELNFHEAVRAGDAKSVAALLARDSLQNLDEPDWNVSGDPPLLVAATNHCLSVLSLLLANGCDPAVRSPRGETALHRVILNGGPGNVLQFVGELLKYGCPPGVKEAGGGLTALHVLTRQLAHAQGSKNLHHNFDAALKTLDLLARAGPVNAKDHQGRSALHILASSTIFDNNHRTEIESLIETLLAAGADPALKNDRGETPLHECLECGALNTAFLLVQHTPTGIMSRYGETPLHIASRKNYADMVAKLLDQGEDPSVQDAGGNTPLHLASARGFHQIVSLLVTSPLAQLEKLNTEGLTALQVAAESGFVNAVKLLLKAGADPSQTVHYCSTTLHRHPDISVLIDHELSRRRQLAA
ncbi:serine/threonine-protein phosphatase 6 regulatory ankyrin repeat subunit C-like [Hylaeus anthracinus]|uniref:serine/threonine-protein phosphatase 6 regulatory ankyrin repeat subunit C-like n=1 Tax=Hylaeus anthracinus TaxID=313031 RepID=UPI0023B8D873|nr:serine/threonine-protein phosphatase 6 regulatory ankyrin repeat subunit C-like [Hylaeus anthracinus]